MSYLLQARGNRRNNGADLTTLIPLNPWAAWDNTLLLMKLTPKGAIFSFLFYMRFTMLTLCMAGISRVGLKSFVESVRLQTLSRAGLQQLQLDVHYLRPLLRR